MSLLQRPGSRLAISVQRLPYVRCPCKFGQVVAGVSTCCESCACLLWPPGAIWWSAAGACDETPRQQGCILRLPLFVRTSTITATSHSVSGSSHGRLRSGFRKQRHLKGRGVGVGVRKPAAHGRGEVERWTLCRCRGVLGCPYCRVPPVPLLRLPGGPGPAATSQLQATGGRAGWRAGRYSAPEAAALAGAAGHLCRNVWPACGAIAVHQVLQARILLRRASRTQGARGPSRGPVAGAGAYRAGPSWRRTRPLHIAPGGAMAQNMPLCSYPPGSTPLRSTPRAFGRCR